MGADRGLTPLSPPEGQGGAAAADGSREGLPTLLPISSQNLGTAARWGGGGFLGGAASPQITGVPQRAAAAAPASLRGDPLPPNTSGAAFLGRSASGTPSRANPRHGSIIRARESTPESREFSAKGREHPSRCPSSILLPTGIQRGEPAALRAPLAASLPASAAQAAARPSRLCFQGDFHTL